MEDLRKSDVDEESCRIECCSNSGSLEEANEPEDSIFLTSLSSPLPYSLPSLLLPGLKKLVDWPTFPMIFVDSELIGGLDILKEQLETGEFKEMIA